MHQRSWAFDHTGVLRDRNLALPLEYPLGEPNNAELQTRIIRAAFALLHVRISPC
jgi:hypothetical protein